MKARFNYVLDLVGNSYWFVPGLTTLAAFILSLVTLAIDARYALEGLEEIAWLQSWLYAGGPEGAREVLSTIAGSMITVAGVVFSITIVALTLASSQFGPRVLANFMRDNGNKLVLGIFIATFLYSLLVLRTIRSGGDESSAVVPHVSVTVALILALVSLGVLIYFIHHVATSIQAPHLIAAIGDELHLGIGGLVPGEANPPSPGEEYEPRDVLPQEFDEKAGAFPAPRTGYLDAVDAQALVDVAVENDLIVHLDYRPGHFVAKGSTLARIWPESRCDERVSSRLNRAIVIGPRRTALQDIEFPINQLVEVAVRALSPGVNDPFTAITCIDQLGAGLSELAARDFPARCWFDDAGAVRLIVARPVTFTGVVDAAFDQVRQNAGPHAAIHIRLLDALERVVACVENAGRLEPLLAQADLIMERSEEEIRSGADRADVRDRYRAVRAAAERKRSEMQSPSR